MYLQRKARKEGPACLSTQSGSRGKPTENKELGKRGRGGDYEKPRRGAGGNRQEETGSRVSGGEKVFQKGVNSPHK